MKKIRLHIFLIGCIVMLFSGCKTNKNTVVHRAYHDLTARFNGYYYATESVKEGEEKIRSAYKYDYDRLLPVFIVPTHESAKTTFPEFDKAIKKSSTCIQRHTIKDKKGNEIPTAGRWIDNNWNVIGVSHFYKREFFSAIEAFEYVIRTYKSNDKYKSMIWLARSYNEIGSPTQAEPIIGLLKDDKKISKYAKKELPAVRADYFIKRGMYGEAQQALIKALQGKPDRKTRARYCFIIAQLYELKNENKNAIKYYQKTIAAKPDYDLVFNAKMKQAHLFDVTKGNVNKLKKDLLAMTRDIKNKEYLDGIYYSLGEIHEREKNEEQAINYYKLSVKNSTQNPKQKALSYLKLGEINFENANYPASSSYYDSTMVSLPKDYVNYDEINNRKKTLETLIGYILTIQREDSLQRIAKLSDSERERFIDKVIKQIEDEEERKKEAQENLMSQNQNQNANPAIPNNGLPEMSSGVKGDWYFYNQTTLIFGINDFMKKWGNRPLEDNWRRSQKAVSFDGQNPNSNDTAATEKKDVTKGKSKSNAKKNKDVYLMDLPLNDSLIKQSNTKIIDAYYNLGSTYKDDLHNDKKAIASFEELNKRFPEHKYKVSTYYRLHKIFLALKNQQQADYYKNKLLSEYPNSEYAQIIKNPKYAAEKKEQKGEVELFYTETYSQYASGNYGVAFAKSNESETKFGKNDFEGKFAFIKAMCIGKLKGVDSLELALKKVQALYPKDPVTKQAQDILEVLYNMKHASDNNSGIVKKDTFSLDLNAPHFVIVIYADTASIANPFKASLTDFNTKFYGNTEITITNSLFGAKQQITTIKPFKNSEEALRYMDNLSKDKTVFSEKLNINLFTIMAISADNLPRFYKKKQVSYYKPFFDDHYKILK